MAQNYNSQFYFIRVTIEWQNLFHRTRIELNPLILTKMKSKLEEDLKTIFKLLILILADFIEILNREGTFARLYHCKYQLSHISNSAKKCEFI